MNFPHYAKYLNFARKTRGRVKYLGRLVVYLAIFFAVFSVSCVVALRFIPVTLTPLKVLRVAESPHGSLFPCSKWRSLGRIDPVMVRAVIASEDSRFTDHNGFDWPAIRQAFRNNQRGGKLHGASTISQQTAKNVFCSYRRTWLRKGLESYYTVLIETLWGKRRIMEVYLNIIETHTDVYGVEAAARRFYGKSASQLNAYEASMIAAVLPSPRRMDLSRPSGYMTGRAAAIRYNMNDLPRIDL